MKVLIVDDEERIAEFISRALIGDGHEALTAIDGESALATIASERPELVILDVMMPGIDGFEVLERLRAQDPELPVIMLTAKDDVPSKVKGLGIGADDYVSKPFALEELLARVRAVTRRTGGADRTTLNIKDLALHLISRELEHPEGRIELSAKEFALLEYLIRNKGTVVGRTEILSHVWGYDFDPGSNIVDVYVSYLRQKLTSIGHGDLIQTIRGAGYRVED